MRRTLATLAFLISSTALHAQTLPDANKVGPNLPIQAGYLAQMFGAKADLSGTATGATAARDIRDRFAETVDVMDYGARCDGVTDDSGAFQAALTSAQTRLHGAEIKTPGGFCYIGSGLTLTIANSQGLSFHSRGQNGTRLLFPATFTGIGLMVQFQTSSGLQDQNHPAFAMDGVTVVSQRTSGVGGTGIQFSMEGSGAVIPSLHIGDLVSTTTSTGGWATSFYLDAMNVTNLDHITCSGVVAGGVCVRYDTAGPISVEHHIDSLYALGNGGTGLQIGTAATTGPLQGFTINTLSCTGTASCVTAAAAKSGVIDQLLINGGQISTTGTGISATYVSTVGLHNVYFLGNATAVYDHYGARFIASGNTFYGGAPNVATAANQEIVLDAVDSGPAGGSNIVGNLFTNLYGAPSGQAATAARPIQIINGSNYVQTIGNMCVGQMCVNDTVGASNVAGPNWEGVTGVGSVQAFDTAPYLGAGVKLGEGAAPAVLSGDGIGNALLSGNLLMNGGAGSMQTLFLGVKGALSGASMTSDGVGNWLLNGANLLLSGKAVSASTLFLGAGSALSGPSLSGNTTTGDLTTPGSIDAASFYQTGFTAPATSSAACRAGQFGFASGYFYACTATNTWQRAALASW